MSMSESVTQWSTCVCRRFYGCYLNRAHPCRAFSLSASDWSAASFAATPGAALSEAPTKASLDTSAGGAAASSETTASSAGGFTDNRVDRGRRDLRFAGRPIESSSMLSITALSACQSGSTCDRLRRHPTPEGPLSSAQQDKTASGCSHTYRQALAGTL